MKALLSATLLVAGISSLALLNNKSVFTNDAHKNTEKKLHNAAERNAFIKIRSITSSLKTYITKNKFNTNYCIIIDMKRPSGSNRFFLYNLKKDTIELAGLVAHGSGSQQDDGTLIFSNVPGSLATSLGKYKIGNSYYGQFGLAYKLHGLDETNSKAFARNVVLHGHGCVPNYEVDPDEICMSWGCPTVAPTFLNEIKDYINNADRPLLLDIVY